MKQKWNIPEVKELRIGLTMEVSTRDKGHGYDDVNHTHICACGMEFDTWLEARDHERLGEGHLIGCIILS